MFSTFFSLSSSTIGSASSGIQETINSACGTYAATNPYFNSQCNVTIPANGPYLGSGGLWSLNNYQIYGTIFFHSNQSTLSGYGVSLNFHGRAPCLQVGHQVKGTAYQNPKIPGIAVPSPDNHIGSTAHYGCPIKA